MQKEIALDDLLKKPTPQDVIGAIFAYSGLPTFPSDRKLLGKFIRDKKTGKEGNLLEPFVFSEGADLYPFSRLLESVLMQLQLGGWLSAKNPEYDKFGITGKIRDDIKKKVSERFSPDHLAILQRIGHDFRDFIEKENQR